MAPNSLFLSLPFPASSPCYLNSFCGTLNDINVTFYWSPQVHNSFVKLFLLNFDIKLEAISLFWQRAALLAFFHVFTYLFRLIFKYCIYDGALEAPKQLLAFLREYFYLYSCDIVPMNDNLY